MESTPQDIRMESLKKTEALALEIATEAHRTQKRRNGEPYIEHHKRVAASIESLHGRAVALLHDVMEDSAMTRDGLVARGIPEYVADEVQMLSKQTDDNYADFIYRLYREGSSVAIQVKIAELEDNLRDPEDTPVGRQRADKYRLALMILKRAPII